MHFEPTVLENVLRNGSCIPSKNRKKCRAIKKIKHYKNKKREHVKDQLNTILSPSPENKPSVSSFNLLCKGRKTISAHLYHQHFHDNKRNLRMTAENSLALLLSIEFSSNDWMKPKSVTDDQLKPAKITLCPCCNFIFEAENKIIDNHLVKTRWNLLLRK